MTTQELRELDAWIAFNIVGFCRIDTKRGGHYTCFYHLDTITGGIECSGFRTMEKAKDFLDCHIAKYSTDSKLAMDVLKKCAEVAPIMVSFNGDAGWSVNQITAKRIYAEAETLELAICLFAKQLFSQTTK